MTKFQKTTVIASIGVVAAFVLFGWVGDYDYCEQVILHMSQEQYDSVKSMLTEEKGEAPSEREIAHWWVEHYKE